MSNFDIRLRRHDAGGAAREIIRHQTLDFTAPLGDVATLRVTFATAITGPLPEVLELAVEIWNGYLWHEAPNARFTAINRDGDELDPSGVLQLTTVNTVSWLLNKTTLASVTGEARRWTETVGLIVLSLIEEAKFRGALGSVDFDFTSLVDSNGQPWNADAKVDLEFEAGQGTWAIIQAMSDQGVIEYQTDGRTLHLYNPGTGEDRSASGDGQARIGITAESLPVKQTIADLATHTTVLGDEGAWTFPATSPLASGYGRLEAVIEGGGVIDGTTARILADPNVQTNSGTRSHYTITENVANVISRPLLDYALGDWVSVRRASGFDRMRVTEVQLRDNGKSISIDISLEDRLQDLQAKLLKRSSALGGGLGGNGRFSRTGGSGSGSSGVYATIADDYNVGALVRVILEGALEPEPVGWRYMDYYRPAKGDKIFAVSGPDGYVILGRAIGAEYTAPGNGEIAPLLPTWTTANPERWGDVKLIKTETEWVLPSGVVIAPGPTAGGFDPTTGEPLEPNDGKTCMQVAGIYRPPMEVRGTVALIYEDGTLAGPSYVTVTTDGLVTFDRAPDAGQLVSLAGLSWNTSVEGLIVRGTYGFGRDPKGVTYGFGADRNRTGGFSDSVPSDWAPAEFTLAIGPSTTYNVATDGAVTGTRFLDEVLYLSGVRWPSVAATENGWSTLHLINGFQHEAAAGSTADSAEQGPLQVMLRDDSGTLVIRGGVRNGIPGSVIAILPEGLRPTYETPVCSDDRSSGYTLRSNGELVSGSSEVRFSYAMHMVTH